jgi:hypothetical protein
MEISSKLESLDGAKLKELRQRCEPLALGFIDIPAEADSHSEHDPVSGPVSAERESSTDELDKRSADSSPCWTPSDNSSIWITQLRNLASQLIISPTLPSADDRGSLNNSGTGNDRTGINDTIDTNTTAHSRSDRRHR